MLREPGRSGWCATGLFRALLLLGLSGLVIQSSPAQGTHEENVASGVVRPAPGSAYSVELLAYPPPPGSVEATWPVGQLPAYRARESVPPEGGSFDLSVGILQLVRVRALLGDRPLAELAAVPLAGWRELPMLRLSRVGDLNLVSIPEAIADSPTPVVLHLQGERPSDSCRVAWRPAERTERIRPDSGRMVLPAIPGDVLLHLFHPLAGVVRVSPGETRWVWPLHSPVSRLVRVVDAEGHPREHALVRFGKTSVPLATTGRGGLATVTLPAGDWHLEVLDTSGERGAWSGSVESASEEVLEIRLGGTVVFRGNAQDARGQALPGVVVWLAEEPAIATSSDALGRFRLSVPRAPAGMTLCLASPWQSQRTVPLRFSSDSETDLGNVVLEGAPRQEGEERGGLRGQLMDEAGSLLAGAVVEAYPAAQNLAVAQRLAGRPRSSPPRAVANASGIFELAGIEEPGELLVVVVAPGLAPALLAPVELFHEHDVADLGVVTVAAGRTLSGRVRESDGTPVAGARVQVSVELTAGSRAESLIAGARAESAAEGEFELTGLPTGVDLRLRAHKEGFEPVEEVVGARERGSGLDLVFARGYRVRGTVTDPAGTPIEGATVAPEIAPSDASTPPALFAERTAADGWFEIASLPCATRAVRVAAPGRFAHSEPLPAVPCGAEIELHLVLEPGSRLAGSVRSEEGAPLAGASVLLRGRSSRSRDDGSFEVDLPLPGPNPVRVQHPGCEPLETVVVAVPGEVVPAAFALRCPAPR